MSELEPLECLYCGGPTCVSRGDHYCHVRCLRKSCLANGPFKNTEAEAVSAHNAPILERRKLHARVGRLEAKARAAVSACTAGLTELVAELEASDESK